MLLPGPKPDRPRTPTPTLDVYSQGAEKIEHAIKAHLGLSEYGETTQDGMFTLSEMECMGACVNAPMIAVADYSSGIEGFSYNFYEDLTTTDVVNVLETLKRQVFSLCTRNLVENCCRREFGEK